MPDSNKLLTEDAWAVVEVLGHNSLAGKVSEHVIGGSAFIRVDVPEMPEHRSTRQTNKFNQATGTWECRKVEDVIPPVPAFTKLIGASSIYAITPCSEEVARRVAEQKRVVPVNVLDVPNGSSPRLIGARSHDNGEDDDYAPEEEEDEPEDDEDPDIVEEARHA